MLRTKLLICALVGVMSAPVLGAPLVVEKPDKTPSAKRHAEPGHHHMRWEGSPLRKLIQGQIGRLMVLRSEIDLSAEQRMRIGKVLREHKSDLLKAFNEVWTARNTLRDAALSGADEGAIRKAADNLGKAMGDAAVHVSKVAKEVKPVLTPEQREKLTKFRAESDAAVDHFFKKASARMEKAKSDKGH